MSAEKISTYGEYSDFLNGRGDLFAFRGQANADFILIPSGLRENNIATADIKMFRFVDEMKKMFGFDELTCIEFAQHFTLPTRMLDFSYSFDVALFFACYHPRGKYYDKDGKVFIFNRSKYERMLTEKNKLSSQVIRNNKFLYEWLQKYTDRASNTEIEGVDMPIFIDATQQFDRLYMQKGMFLLWGKDDIPLEQILVNEGGHISDFSDTVIIDKDSKKKILDELAAKNICEDTLYMNVSKIKSLVDSIKYQGRK